MKILYLHQYFRTPEMGGGTRSFEFARRLVAAGHKVSIVTADTRPRRGAGWRVEDLDGIKVHWVSVPYSNDFGFFKRVRAFMEFSLRACVRCSAIDYDIVFATSTPLTIVIPGVVASRRRKVPMVFEVRDLWPAVPVAMGVLSNPLLISAARLLESIAYLSSTGVVALAPGMRDEVLRTGAISADRVVVIPNGCDSEIFGADLSVEAGALRSATQWLGHRPLVLFAGTLGKANGVAYFVEVAAKMREIAPEVRFVVIGDGAERSLVETAARRLGVLNTSLFFLPHMSKRDLSVWIAASNFTAALFSGPEILYRDAVQNKFFDSLAAGKPVMCNFTGFQSLIAVESDIGIIIPPDDPLAAARALFSRLEDEAWLEGVPSRCDELVRARFSRDLLAVELERFLLASAGSSGS